jgi:bifunctional DNA-binding transcriptional regulator/antitoxin component of YhaV-PrlF toxin-antitoxin module
MALLLIMVKTRVSSKGQTTIPRRFLKLWKTSQVLWDLNPDGTARVSPTPDIMSLLGSAADGKPHDPDEKQKARAAIGRNAAQEGLER